LPHYVDFQSELELVRKMRASPSQMSTLTEDVGDEHAE
jgi:alpha-D-ribose 1-methylphosphonate 5-triphosphate synthase subunit PhnI